MHEQRPVYHIAAAGLDPRDVRLIEIVFKHSQYNRFAFVLDPVIEPDRTDILIVDTVDPEGLRAVTMVRGLARHVPVIAAVQRGVPSPARHAISIDRLTLQLLPILNRVVETELLSPETQPMTMPMTLPLPHEDAAAFLVRPAVSAWPSAQPAAQAQVGGPNPAAADAGNPAGAARTRSTSTWPPASRPASGPASTATSAGTSAGTSASEAVSVPSASARLSAASSSASAWPSAPSSSSHSPAGAGESGHEPAQRPAAPQVRPAAAAPAAAAASPSNLVEFPRAAMPNGQGPRIRVLVVDDSPTVRQQLAVAFTRMGLVCEMVATGSQALERLDSAHYDLVMVDVVIPDMDGYRLTREIRKHHRGVPVIILSSRSSPFDYARGLLAGCKAYLAKPVPLRQLETAMHKVLRKSLAIDDLSDRLGEYAARRSGDDGAHGGRTARKQPEPSRSRRA